jgi:hypothetical protein
MTTLRSAMLVAAALAVALIGMSAALAESPRTIDRTVRFEPTGGLALCEGVDGDGKVTTGLAGKGDGHDLRSGVVAFAIRPR